MSQWTGCNHQFSRICDNTGAAFRAALFFTVLMLALPASAAAIQTGPDLRSTVGLWEPLAQRLIGDGVDPAYVDGLFHREEMVFDPDHMSRKMRALLATKQAATPSRVGQAESRPAEPQVMDRYLNPILIAGAYAYLREHHDILVAAEQKYGVDGDHLVALLLVETRLGTNTGDHSALPVLASMALAGDFQLIREFVHTDDVPPEILAWLVERTRQKGDWAYEELRALIEYAQANGQDPLSIPGSVYGAIGLCQFMPTTARHYGVDGNGDGRVDLFNASDALHSMANFLKRHGWKAGLDEEARLSVLYRYNHSRSYALTVDAVASWLTKARELFGS